ncbi:MULTISPECIES: hypothetical protein [Halorussus]|uniref:hypothetical protein n=1 Tax=Halorussus TaxID=1070314 RepID=UPI0013B3C7CD|nr:MULTISPECIES: hypothetical protein [Halorussus]NHN58903.1 hypothetical protein [Halorussus sp. JP-T4]
MGDRLDPDASPKHASQAVTGVVAEAASTGELQHVISEFPENEGYGELLALADRNAS